MFSPFAVIEALINRALSFDARSSERLEKLQGKKLSVEISDFKLSVLIQFSAQGLHFSKPISETPDVSIKGPLAAFVSLLISKDPYAASRLGLSLEGDMQAAEDSQTLFLTLQIDWEEILSRLTGDSFAHQFFSLLKKGQQQQKVIWDNLSYTLGDYLQEETRVLPTRPEVELFLDDVDAVNLDIDRLAARLNQLEVTEGSLE